VASYVDSIQLLLNEMPPDIQATLRNHEADETFDDEYLQARMKYFAKHMCRLSSMPDDLMACFVGLQQDPTVNHTMLVSSLTLLH
jgi:L-proline amide hydrolase